MEQLLKVLTDPVSNRILQMIRMKGRMTISEILSENAGIPRATIYSKMDKMLEVFLNEDISEYFFYKENGEWMEVLK